MLRRELSLCFAVLIALVQLSQCDAVVAQRPSRHSYRPTYGNTHVFPKAAAPTRSLTPAKVSPQIRGNSFNGGLKPKQFNQSFQSSRLPSKNFKSFSPTFSRGFFPQTSFGFGFQTPFYDPFLPAYRPSNNGFRSFVPAYVTYGNLFSGTVLNVGPSSSGGSSVAAEALQRLANQQPVVPNQNGNAAQEAEILRLQIELEKARQQLALQNQQGPAAPPAVQRTLKPAVADNQDVIDQLGLAAIIETNDLASASQLKAEQAFRSGDYGKAARFADLATSLDESNGKLMLFASQAHFANQEYSEAVDALKSAAAILETKSEDLSFVIANFKLFYGQNDFVSQIKQLSNRLKQFPDDADAWLLRGYQYGALGHPAAAKKDLQKAKHLGASASLADQLLIRFAAEN